MINAILYDDNALFRSSIRYLMTTVADIRLIGDFAEAHTVVTDIMTLKPDIVILDIEMPKINGLDVLKKIRQANLDTKVIMLTSFEDEQKIFAALCNGASGYILKGDAEKVEESIRDVVNGGGHFSPKIAAKVIKLMQSHVVVSLPQHTPLTPREQDVLLKMVEGNSRKMIAYTLNLQLETINGYIKEIYRKLHVNSASEAVREAITKKIV